MTTKRRRTGPGPRPIRKAVFPVAGFGTRLLPATKSTPKEMLTIIDRPVIQYAVDEARAAGIEQLIFVTGRNKGAIEDYFDLHDELYRALARGGKEAELRRLEALQPAAGTAIFTRQQAPLGLGHAVWCARDLVGDEPFALILPDMLLEGGNACLRDLAAMHGRTGGNVIAVQDCAPDEVGNYGIVAEGASVKGGFEVADMVEKPARHAAPSRRFALGRYVLQPGIFAYLERQAPGAGGEIQLTDALLAMRAQEKLYACPYEGRLFDCGTPRGLVEANIAFALDHDALAHPIATYIERVTGKADRPGRQAAVRARLRENGAALDGAAVRSDTRDGAGTTVRRGFFGVPR